MTPCPWRGDGVPDGTGGADIDDGDGRPADGLDAPAAPDAPAGSSDQRCAEPVEAATSRVAADEPLAVIATGPAGAARRDVLAALLDVPPPTVPMPDDSYLVARYAPEPTRVAFVPGYRQPHAYAIDVLAAGPAFPRPPRRVELHLPAPLLRHVALVGAPDTDGLGVAGTRVLREAVGRGGAVLVVVSADQVFTGAELELLNEAARAGLAVFFVVTPGTTGWHGGVAPTATAPVAPEPATADPTAPVAMAPDSAAPGPATAAPADGTEASGGEPAVAGAPSSDPVGLTVQTQRTALLAVVPELAAAPWFPFRPGDVRALRRALVAWAAEEGPRRLATAASAGPHRTVPVAPDAHRRNWADGLDRQARTHVQRIRQHLSLELAHIHLRGTQEIVFGLGCAGLPRLLDREVYALSQLATVECDRAVGRMVRDTGTEVFGARPDDATYRRICAAVRAVLAGQRADRSLERVLLVTSAGDLTEVTGAGALAALDGHPGAPRTAVLPPVAVAVAGGCYLHFWGPGGTDQGGARSWLQHVLRELDRELQREVSRRVEVARRALGVVLADAVDHGILLT
ncbi:hypothetical protein ACIBJE_28800 [Micromonospora sp. NPDC050187]|uniref:hypothetical protein n=1 Tax=Micromonospora sp. NPDC050187 TaxID=3364277 RepID=UPI003799BCD9